MPKTIVNLPDGRTFTVPYGQDGIPVRALVAGPYGEVGNEVVLSTQAAIDALRKGIVEPAE